MQTESGQALAWLKSFEEEHGRPLRVLHIGNIANNAYINAKIQRRIGIEADVSCHDYFHIMGCPEWEDADFEGDVHDQFFPDWWAVDLKGFVRPAWFAQGRQRTCQRYLLAMRRGDTGLAHLLQRQLRLELWLRCRSTRRARLLATLVGVVRGGPPAAPGFEDFAVRSVGLEAALEWVTLTGIWVARLVKFALAWLRWRLRVTVLRRLAYGARWSWSVARTAARKSAASVAAVRALAAGRGWRSAALMIAPRKLSALARTDDHHASVAAAFAMNNPASYGGTDDGLSRLYDELFPAALKRLEYEDYADFSAAIPAWRDLLAEYDVVQAYATDPLIPLMCDVDAYAAYEHGTLRDLPFEDSPRGRLCALSYRAAPAVFVTNSDVLPAARRLGLTEEQMVFLPHAVDSDRLQHFAAEHEHLRPNADAEEIVFLSPTRHDWWDGDPLWAKGNDRLIRALAVLRDEGFDCHLRLFDWGRHVSQSKELITSLALDDRISWESTMRKRALWAAYMSSHAVVDQFLTPAMGSVAFESLALGCRVITALDRPTVEEFFTEVPPVLNSATVEEIAEAMRSVIADPGDRAGVGRAAQEWFARHHSTDRILELELRAYERIVGAPSMSSRNA